jgi:WD40 repeat protein
MPIFIPASTLEKFTTFGDLLRFLRRRIGLTQMELATAVGYSDTQISRLEQNLRLPDIPTVEARFVSALGLEDESKAVARLLELAANVRREDAPALGLCPYKGLNYFDETDADLFVGREALTTKLVERVLSLTSNDPGNQARFLAIVGASGSGKSSLVRAGVIYALRWNKFSTDWHIHVFTPTVHPLESLAATLTHESNSVMATATLIDDLTHDPRSLQIFAKHKLGATNESRFLLVVDQFEELFALCRSEEERAAFIGNLLTAASEPDGPVILLITLRADFYAHCASYPQLREALARQQEYIGAMNVEEMRRAIEEPAQRGRWELESGLVDVLLHDVGHEPGALPLLSHALFETWQRRRARLMTLSGYAASGGVRGAIAETAETVFTDQFTHEQQAIARRIFLRLTELNDETSASDTRRRASFKELILKPEEAATTHTVLKALADARLITTSEDSAEVAHEALIREWPTLREWLNQDREGLRLHRHLTEAAYEWELLGRDPGALYRGAHLVQAREWATFHPNALNAAEQEFLDSSIEQEQHEELEREEARQRELAAAKELAETQRQSASRLRIRHRVITTVGSIAVILALLVGLFAVQSNQQRATALKAQSDAEANFRQAEAQRLAAEASKLFLSKGSPELIALLSLQSMNIQYTSQGDAALATAARLNYPNQLFVSTGADTYISAVTFSPDGQYVLTGNGSERNATLWNALTGKKIRNFDHHKDVLAVAYSPDGKYIVTGSGDNTASLWDAATGKEVRRFIGDVRKVTTSVAFSSDGKYVLTGSLDKMARLWDVTTGKEIRQFISQAAILSIAFSPDSQYALLGQRGGTVSMWEVQTGTEVRQFTGHDSSNAIAFSPDGKFILTGGYDLIARLWDAKSGQELQNFIGHTNNISSVAFSPDGKYVFTGSDDGTARKWDKQSGQELQRYIGPASGGTPLAVSPDGKSLVAGNSEGEIRLWSIKPVPKLPVFKNTGIVNGLAFSPDGEYVLTGDSSGMVSMWDAITGEKVRGFIGHTDIINYGVALSPDGKYVLTGSWDFTVRLWDIQNGKELRKFIGPTRYVNSVAFSPDGKYIVAGALDGVWVWVAETGKEVWQLDKFYTPVRVTFSPDSKYIATVGENVVHVWDVRTGQMRFFTYGFNAVSSIAFSPDGKYLLAASDDNTARLWDIQMHKEILRFTGHAAGIWTAIFSPDGKYVATASADGTARIWDAQTSQELRRFVGHTASVENVVFSPDGKYLLTGSDDSTALLWDVDYHTTIQYLCSILLRDFTDTERTQYNITNKTPTCPQQ